MVISFVPRLRNDSRFLQQILLDFGALDDALVIEVDVDVLSESGRIIVSNRFRVTESCKICGNIRLSSTQKKKILDLN